MEYKIIHSGSISFGEVKVPCYALENTTRVRFQRGLQKVLKIM